MTVQIDIDNNRIIGWEFADTCLGIDPLVRDFTKSQTFDRFNRVLLNLSTNSNYSRHCQPLYCFGNREEMRHQIMQREKQQ